MTCVFDTSVLFAALIESHVHHDSAFSLLKRASDKELATFISAHSLLELYATLTTYPIKPKLRPIDVKSLINKNIKPFMEIITLSKGD